MTNYYSLLVRDNSASPWCIDFGDYSFDVVNEEREDRLESDDELLYTNIKIITTGFRQKEIDEAVAKLNERFSK